MTVRSLSSTSFWIEMPLSPQACLLVWHAMFASGLRSGRINSHWDEHFTTLYSWRPHLVEGRTPQGFLDEKSTIQARLIDHEGGTLIELSSANTNGDLDFGTSRRVRRRVLPRMLDFLQRQPVDWHAPSPDVTDRPSPIASPHDTGCIIPCEPPRFESIHPITTHKITVDDWKRLGAACLKDWKQLLGITTLLIAAVWFNLGYLWPFVFIVSALVELWGIHKKRLKFVWWSCWPSLLFGFYHAWPLVRSWF